MPIQTITVSSANLGASTAAALNWRSAEPATVSVLTSTTGTATATFILQYTLDDLQLVGGASVAFWQGVSSAIGSSGTAFSVTGVDGVFFPFVTPVAAVRLNTSAMSSGPLIMKVLQGEGG